LINIPFNSPNKNAESVNGNKYNRIKKSLVFLEKMIIEIIINNDNKRTQKNKITGLIIKEIKNVSKPKNNNNICRKYLFPGLK